MKRYFCEKCSGILPGSKIVCDKCGYENPELIPVFREQIKRRIVIGRITKIAAAVGLIVILHANFLLPWQWKAFNNKMTMLSYAKENYPNAKIVSQHYESTKFNPWSTSFDSITFKWNDVEFSLLAENGRLVRDNYWYGAGEKFIYENCLKPFFDKKNVNFRYEMTAFGMESFLKENPNNDLTQFDGAFTIIIYPQFIKGKLHPRDLGWVYDFYLYWKDNVSLQHYTVRIIYPEETYFLNFTNESAFISENEFYSAVKTFR